MLNYVMFVKFKWTNHSCSSSKISQSVNVERCTCDRNGKQFFHWKLDKLWSLDKARNVLIEKNIYSARFRELSTFLKTGKEQQSC